MLAAAFSSAELPEGSADPVELSTRVEDGTEHDDIWSEHCQEFECIRLAIFRELKDTGTRYRNRIRSRVSNLKDPKNINLRSDVLLGRITAERLAVLTAEVCSFNETRDRHSILFGFRLGNGQRRIETRTIETQRSSDQWVSIGCWWRRGNGSHPMQTVGSSWRESEKILVGFCWFRCKQNNCAYTEVQTRGADEPMTLFVFCKSCGNRWKVRERRQASIRETPRLNLV